MVSMLLVTILTFWVWTLCAFSKLQFGVQVVAGHQALVSGFGHHPLHESCRGHQLLFDTEVDVC